MSFVQTLWASLAQTYSLSDCTTSANDMTSQQPKKLYEERDAASGQLGQLWTEQQPCHSQQSQSSQWIQQLQDPQFSYPHLVMQNSSHTAQHPDRLAQAHHYANVDASGFDGGSFTSQAQ